MPHRRLRILAPVLAALALAAGCKSATTCTTATSCPTPPACATCVAPPDQTYIYVANGGDPLLIGRADVLAEKFREYGYPHTQTLSWRAARLCEADVRRVHAADPGARFVLIGYSLGSYTMRDAARRLVRDGVPVAMVAYIGGDYLSDTPRTQLAGVGRVVNITGNGHPFTGGNLFFNGTDVTGARNVRLAGTGHFDLPAHPTTFEVLREELAAATGGP